MADWVMSLSVILACVAMGVAAGLGLAFRSYSPSRSILDREGKPRFRNPLDYIFYKTEERDCLTCGGKGSLTASGDMGDLTYDCIDCEGKGYVPVKKARF